ncbi:unnamed protein product [Linum tenue]|uniref:Uncharacterized protein n=1 Tax=Linum tenue TaxID=586396 RepID=A0AAV0ND47_9ROSI|nr:unnamed protein product [Linum tenue]
MLHEAPRSDGRRSSRVPVEEDSQRLERYCPRVSETNSVAGSSYGSYPQFGAFLQLVL